MKERNEMADKKRNKDNKCECASIIKTPKHWQEMELVKTTTAYGNEVMIPMGYAEAWELERLVYLHAKEQGKDLSIGVENIETSMSMTQEKKNALLVFYEKYQKEL